MVFGSNIEPAKNIPCAINHLRLQPSINILKYSSVWQTKSVGRDAPDFFNVAILVETELNAKAVKTQVISHIETRLKRVRTVDKFAPRTIDIDILIFNNQMLDENIFEYEYLVFPLAELVPEYSQPGKHQLGELADMLKPGSTAKRLEGLLENSSKWPC